MSNDSIFSLANLFAITGWVALAVRPFWRQSDKYVVGVVATLLAMLYAWLLASALTPADLKAFGSLDGIAGLFQNRTALLAGWVHYLAFDLMAGLFIVKNAEKHRINHWLAMLCGFGTFMMGPLGLLLYLIIRAIRTRSLFAEN